jgi:prepilin-type N-terminal cleavage/methylation domain-containing protein
MLATRHSPSSVLRFALGRRGDLTPSPLSSGSSFSPPRKRSLVHAQSASLVTRLPKGRLAEPRLSSPVTGRRPAAFTLIELLVVIAIIAILASLAFPAVQGALEQGKRAQARNDVNQLATAVKAYQLEYGKLPGSGTTDGAAPSDLMTTLTSSNTNNPRGIVFFEPKIAKAGKGGLDGTTYKDPWGNAYTITLDYNYDNKIDMLGQTNFTTVIVTSPGATEPAPTNKLISNIK